MLKSQTTTNILLHDVRSCAATAMQKKNGNNHQKRGGGGFCCRCICYCCCLLSLLISILIMIVFYFDPKIPIFKIESINVKALGLSPDSGLTIDLLVTVRTVNPNKNIGFIYGNGGWVGIEYSGFDICGGDLPAFHQGGESTTSFKVELKGKSAFGREMVEVLMEQQKSGRIPAMVKLKVPVMVAVGEMRLRELILFVNVSLVLDSFSPDIATSIVSIETVFRIQML